MEINFFILDCSPRAFHKDVILDPTTTIHADPDPRILKMLGKLHTGKLNPLVRIADLRFGDSKGLFQRPNTKSRIMSSPHVVHCTIPPSRWWQVNMHLIPLSSFWGVLYKLGPNLQVQVLKPCTEPISVLTRFSSPPPNRIFLWRRVKFNFTDNLYPLVKFSTSKKSSRSKVCLTFRNIKIFLWTRWHRHDK